MPDALELAEHVDPPAAPQQRAGQPQAGNDEGGRELEHLTMVAAMADDDDDLRSEVWWALFMCAALALVILLVLILTR